MTNSYFLAYCALGFPLQEYKTGITVSLHTLLAECIYHLAAGKCKIAVFTAAIYLSGICMYKTDK